MDHMIRRAAGQRGGGQLLLKLGEVTKKLECGRIGQGIAIVNRPAVDHVAHRELGNFTADCSRNIRHCNNFPGDVMGTGKLADPLFDPASQVVGQANTVSQADKENDPDVALPILTNYQAFKHFWYRFHLAVNLGGPDPHPARVEGGVAPSQNDEPIMLGQAVPVAMAPHSGEVFIIFLPVLRSRGISPERHRHAGKRSSANQFTFLLPNRAPPLVEHLDAHAQSPGLQLSPPDRRNRISQRKARYDVGPAADAREMNVGFDLLIDEIKATTREWAAG